MSSAQRSVMAPAPEQKAKVGPVVIRNNRIKAASPKPHLSVVKSTNHDWQTAEKSRRPVFICNESWEIVSVNSSAQVALEAMESRLQRSESHWKGFSAANVLGMSVEFMFTDEPIEFERATNPRNWPFRKQVQLGNCVCDISLDSLEDEDGNLTGFIVEWEDVTHQLEEKTKFDQLVNALANCTTNVMLTDKELKLTYINNSLAENLQKWESEFKKVFGANFRADQLLGRCIDDFHRDPSHQRRMMANESIFPMKTHIRVGSLRIDLAVNVLRGTKGEVIGYSTEWLDVTERIRQDEDYKAAVKTIADRMEFLRGACSTDLASAMDALANGDLTYSISPQTPLLEIPEHPDLAIMAETFNNLRNQTVKSVEAYNEARRTISLVVGQAESCARDLAQAMQALADGNLAHTIEDQSERQSTADTFSNLRPQILNSVEAYNRAQKGLSTLVGQAKITADGIKDASSEVMTGNDDLAQRTEEQAASLEETAASMEEMTSTVKQNADNAKQANQLAMQAREAAEKGGQVVGRAVSTMNEINAASKRIADIISVIDEIAFQTNLLALNAAVEAARVGEQGRGFAVVAAEVRNLAGRSATAAKEIKGLVQDSVQKVQEGSGLVNESGSQLNEIVTSVKKVADIIAEITAAAQEQSEGIEQVNKAIVQMDQITQQNAALVEEASAASQSMNHQASDLEALVGKFQIDATFLAQLQSQYSADKPTAMNVRPTESKHRATVPAVKASRKAAPVKARSWATHNDEFEEF